MKKLNVLSLFDGISAGQMALKKAEIEVDKYFASEIDKHAIHVTNKNFPNTVQLGDITKWREWDIDWKSIDLVMGGSPCQGFSFAGKQLNFEDPRSKLFFVFLDICNHVADNNPKMVFLLENVKMKKEYQNVISEKLGIEPIEINSALVSAQNRKRLYWTNIRNIEQPKDKGVLLKDITIDGINQIGAQRGRYLIDGKTVQRLELRKDNKTNTLTTVQKDNILVIEGENLIVPEATKKGYCEVKPNNGVDLTFINSKTRLGRLMEHKSNCLTATKYDYNWFDGKIIRRLTPVECERLQTFPDNYTEGVSDSQRYKALGNSWTVDVIVHIFKNLI